MATPLEVSAKKDMVVRSFKKCGISVAIDGSEVGEIHINGLEDNVMEDRNSEDEYTDEDPFGDCTEDVSLRLCCYYPCNCNINFMWCNTCKVG